MNLNQFSLLMAGTAGICLFLAAHSWSRRAHPAARSLALFLISAAIWSFFYAMEFELQDPAYIRAVMTLEYLGIATSPVFFLLFAARYSGSDRWLTRSSLLLLLVVPIITVSMVATNEFHHLYYLSREIVPLGANSVVKLDTGPFWWLHVVYSHTLLVAALTMLARLYFSVSRANRLRVGYLLIAALLPSLVSVAYVIGYRPLGFLDLTPAAFGVTGIVLSAGIFTMDLLDIRPVALDMLVRGIPDAVLVLDAGSAIVEANPAAEALLRSPSLREQVTRGGAGAGGNDAGVPAGLIPEVEVTVAGRTYSRKDTGLYSSSGGHVGTLVILRDITERKRAEQKLRQSRDQYHSLVNNIPGAAYQRLLNEGRTVQYMSAGIEELTGYPPGDYLAPAVRSFESIIHPSDNERVQQAIATAIRAGTPWQLEYRILHRDGGVRWVYEKGAVSSDPVGGERTLNGFVMDITQQKRDREEAERSHRELRRLTTHLQTVREEERAAVAWELHDEVGQALSVVRMDIAACSAQLPKDTQTQVAFRIDKIEQLLDNAITRLRRLYTGLRPGMLDDLGLAATIEWQASEFARETGIECRVSGMDDVLLLDHRTGLAVFRAVQGVLAALARDSGATSVDISVEREDHNASIRIIRDGPGAAESDWPAHVALEFAAMRDRLHECHGTLSTGVVTAGGEATVIRVPLAR